MEFEPIRTHRLLLRPMELGDAPSLFARRNDPRVAEYQNWSTPFRMEEAIRLVTELVAMDGPEDEEWWMCCIADPDTGEVFGDLALHLGQNSRTAEIGYTLAAEHWAKGYAAEAAAALVEYLFDTVGVTRVFGMLHPDNPASAQVLERVGMLFEGHTRQSFWLDGEVSDDWIYGMIRSDWEAWKDRPRHRPEAVSLVEVTGAIFSEVYALRTHKTQESFVAPMAKSLAQALLAPSHPDDPVTPWCRAIRAAGLVVGFVMVALPTPDEPEPFLWRLLVDRMHQRRGVGSMALDLVEAEMKAMGHEVFLTSWLPGKGGPEPFYLGRRYVPTGEVDHGEVVGRKTL